MKVSAGRPAERALIQKALDLRLIIVCLRPKVSISKVGHEYPP